LVKQQAMLLALCFEDVPVVDTNM